MGAVRLHVEALKKHQCLAACAEPTETAQSLGDDTHAAVTAAKEGIRARTTHREWSLCISGFDRCADKDVGKHERKTPTLCGRTGQENEKEKEEEERGGERKR